MHHDFGGLHGPQPMPIPINSRHNPSQKKPSRPTGFEWQPKRQTSGACFGVRPRTEADAPLQLSGNVTRLPFLQHALWRYTRMTAFSCLGERRVSENFQV